MAFLPDFSGLFLLVQVALSWQAVFLSGMQSLLRDAIVNLPFAAISPRAPLSAHVLCAQPSAPAPQITPLTTAASQSSISVLPRGSLHGWREGWPGVFNTSQGFSAGLGSHPQHRGQLLWSFLGIQTLFLQANKIQGAITKLHRPRGFSQLIEYWNRASVPRKHGERPAGSEGVVSV